MLKSIALVLSTSVLFACGPSAEQLAVRDAAACQSYGYKLGTSEFATCRMLTANRREDYRREKAQMIADGFERGFDQIAEGQRRAASTYRPVNCTQLGNHISCY